MTYEWDKMTPLEEVYAIRRRIAEKFGYSIDAIFDAGIREQREAESRGEVLHFAKLPIARPFSGEASHGSLCRLRSAATA